MTLTDELKIFDDTMKENQAQYDLDREGAKMSALSSKEWDKYEYLTGEDLGCKPSVVGKAKFECSPLGEVLSNKAKSKADKNKVVNTNKQDKNLFYNLQESFVKFKDVSDFKELPLDSMHKKLNAFHKNLLSLKNSIHKQKKRKI